MAAIANEGGGKLIFGVKNDRKIVGSKVYQGTENKLPHEILQNTNLKVFVQPLYINKKRVVIFFIPPRPIGMPVASSGKYRYPMRAGESLVEMDTGTLQQIFSETEPDFSSEVISSLSVSDLNKEALSKYRLLWSQKANRKEYLNFDFTKMLRSLNLITEKGVTHTALILFGKKEVLNNFLPDTEIVFEWRQDLNKTNYDYRRLWRDPFILIYDQIWDVLDARNTKYSFQEGLIQRNLKAFDEKPFREALLNAVCHRDYKMRGHSIFIKASTDSYQIESPGGLVSGITLKNILLRTAWRNRRLAESLEKAGLVERSGQGLDDIFEISIRNGKGSPQLEEVYSSSFKITIPAKIKDEQFIKFLESISSEVDLSFEEILELERIREEAKVKDVRFRDKLLSLGLVEMVGRGRSTRYILSHKYYKGSNQAGIYTRLSGISREKYKELILKHIRENGKGKLRDFKVAFSELTPMDISNLLRELKQGELIIFDGDMKSGSWVMRKTT